MRVIVAILLCLPVSVLGQETGLQGWMGASTFAMNTQKEFQNDIKDNSGLPVALSPVHSFDPYWNWGLGYFTNLSKGFAIGIWYEQNSTGGRLSYKDYSGSFTVDQVLSCWQTGLFVQKQLNRSTSWPLFATLHIAFVVSSESVSSNLTVGGSTLIDEFTLEATNVAFRPGLMLQRKVGPFHFQTALGYDLHAQGALKTNDDQSLTTQDGDEVTVDWSGLRFRLGLMLPIRFTKKTKS